MIDWIMEHTLLCLLALAALGTVFWVWTQRGRLAMSRGWVVPISLLHVAYGVACVKVFAVLEAGSLEAAGKMSLFGAVFLLPAAYWLGAKLTKRKPETVFDVFVVPTVFTLACARVNCLLSGCCLGCLIPGAQTRWPTREAELVFYALLLVWLVLRTRKGETGGVLYPAYMAAYGCFRFFTEFFRESASPNLFHLAHLWALLCAALGFAFLIELRRRAKTNKATSRAHRRKTK